VTWSTEDGKHECWVAARFADGAFSAGRSGQGFQIGCAGDGIAEQWVIAEEWRADADAVGWTGVCTCGWRSQPWTRVHAPADEDLAARRAFGDYLPGDGRVLFDSDHRGVEDAVHAEWKRHIEPDLLLGEIAELTERRRDLDERLAAAVGKARQAKATWEDIGRAAGMTRQSAHERWRDAAGLNAEVAR